MYSINKKSGNVLPSFLKQLSGLGLLDLSEYRLIYSGIPEKAKLLLSFSTTVLLWLIIYFQ